MLPIFAQPPNKSLAAYGSIACFSSSFFPFSLDADRAPQLKASVRPLGYLNMFQLHLIPGSGGFVHLKNALRHPRLALASLWLICSLLFLVNPHATYAQSPAEREQLNTKAKQSREMGLAMLGEMKEILEEHYYDRKFLGVDLKTRFQAAKDQNQNLKLQLADFSGLS